MSRLAFLLALVGVGTAGPFVCEEGSFSVGFPSTPIQDTLTVPTPEGPQLRRVFRYSDDDVVYFLVHTCVPPPTLPADPKAALDLGRDGGLATAGGTLVSEKRLSVGGRPATRLVTRMPNVGLSYSLIVLGDHGNYYSLSAGPRAPAATSKAEAFLDSFTILPSTSRAWCHGK